MSETNASKGHFWPTFFGSLGAILIFGLIIFLAYLPNRAAPINEEVSATRRAKAAESRAAGIQKISNFEMINAESGIARIPIADAMSLTVAAYQSGKVVQQPLPAEPAPEPAATTAE
jgi:hypothetical protein